MHLLHPTCRPLLLLAVCSLAHAGILVTRSEKGLQFIDAAQILINGKDKALTLGNEAKLTAPINKLKDLKLTGSLIKDLNTGVVASVTTGGVEYILPDNLPKTAPADPAAIWKAAAKISYKKAPNDKAATDIAAAEFVAFLVGGREELTRLCMDEFTLGLVGGKGKTFATQSEWILAVVKDGANPAAAPLEKYVESAMAIRYHQFESGAAGLGTLEEALKLVELSQNAYPNRPAQAELRKAITDRKAWLDRRVAILRAFDAAQEWDALLLGARDFEKYQRAFPELSKKHSEALKASLAMHRDTGERRLKDAEYGVAWREFRLASLRQPSDKSLQQKVLMAWTEYSRQLAADQQKNRPRITEGERAAISQALTFADGYLKQGKLDLALKNTLDAERVNKSSLQVLLKKAEILGAQHEYTGALAALDDYDRLAVNEERKPASDLRNELLFKRATRMDEVKTQTRKAWSEQRFHRVLALSREGLRARDDDADLLYMGGLAALMTRDSKQGREILTRYLDVSNTLDADEAQRARARQVLATVGQPLASGEGEPNWLSGRKLPSGVYYDPVSLAFQPRIDNIDASNKLRVNFEWNGNRLVSITPVFEKNERVTGEKKISFGYEDRVPQVAVVEADEKAPAPLSADPDERFHRSNVVLINNPYVDPAAVQNLTSKNITIGVAGNRFFNPFVWERPYYFQLAYDPAGRIVEAREIADAKAGAGGVLLQFEWDGLQLKAVRARQGADANAPRIYERTMQYQEGRLIGEDIQASGKNSKIKYLYNAGRLVSAECGTDQTLDNRNRKVAFK